MRRQHSREKEYHRLLPLHLCFPLPLLLVVLLSCFCPYSFDLSCFFTHHFHSVILTFLCLPYLLPNPLPFSLLSISPSTTLSLFASVLPCVFLSHSLTLFSTQSSSFSLALPLPIISPSVFPFPPCHFFPTPLACCII